MKGEKNKPGKKETRLPPIAGSFPEILSFLLFSFSLFELIGILLDMSLPYRVIVLGVFSWPKSQQSL